MIDARAILVAAALVLLGASPAFTAPAHKEQADGCDHGNANKPCKDDPQPDHGAECEAHGNHGGVNEDHCNLTSTTTASTTTTTSAPATTTTTSPSSPTVSTATTSTTSSVTPSSGSSLTTLLSGVLSTPLTMTPQPLAELPHTL